MHTKKFMVNSLLKACGAGWLMGLLLVLTVSNYLVYTFDQTAASTLITSAQGMEQNDHPASAGSGLPGSGTDEKASSSSLSLSEEYTHEKDPHYSSCDRWELPFPEQPHQPLLQGPNTALERPPCC